MSITLTRETNSDIQSKEKEAAKQILLDEVELRINLQISGIRYNREEISRFQDPARLNDRSRRNRENVLVGGTGSFYLPHGIYASGSYNRYTPYSLVVESDKPVLYDEEQRIGEITFHHSHPVLEETLRNGEKFKEIAGVNLAGGIDVGYSNQCSLTDQGQGCLFCGQSATGGPLDPIRIKTPAQVSEAYHIARQYNVGNQMKITGGYIPERRELDAYLDVADAIRAQHPDFNAVAVIGAPTDLSILQKYKEAGYNQISIHIEVWDKDIFRAICPGKEKQNGGWQNWINALEQSVDIFGRGNVDSNLVIGLEPKASVLEGVEYLASKGIVCTVNIFSPRPGGPLEGYRTPDANWHFDVIKKSAEIYLRHGFSVDQVFGPPIPSRPIFEVTRILAGDFEGDRLEQWKFPSLSPVEKDKTRAERAQ